VPMLVLKKLPSGDNTMTLSYNASIVKIYSAANS
jgi:hypothetical protein